MTPREPGSMYLALTRTSRRETTSEGEDFEANRRHARPGRGEIPPNRAPLCGASPRSSESNCA